MRLDTRERERRCASIEHGVSNGLDGCGSRRHIFSTALRLGRRAAALAVDDRRCQFHQVPGVNAGLNEIVAGRDQEVDRSVVDSGKRDHAAREPVSKRARQVA